MTKSVFYSPVDEPPESTETVQTCSLSQIMHALFEVGGQYRRSK